MPILGCFLKSGSDQITGFAFEKYFPNGWQPLVCRRFRYIRYTPRIYWLYYPKCFFANDLLINTNENTFQFRWNHFVSGRIDRIVRPFRYNQTIMYLVCVNHVSAQLTFWLSLLGNKPLGKMLVVSMKALICSMVRASSITSKKNALSAWSPLTKGKPYVMGTHPSNLGIWNTSPKGGSWNRSTDIWGYPKEWW